MEGMGFHLIDFCQHRSFTSNQLIIEFINLCSRCPSVWSIYWLNHLWFFYWSSCVAVCCSCVPTTTTRREQRPCCLRSWPPMFLLFEGILFSLYLFGRWQFDRWHLKQRSWTVSLSWDWNETECSVFKAEHYSVFFCTEPFCGYLAFLTLNWMLTL